MAAVSTICRPFHGFVSLLAAPDDHRRPAMMAGMHWDVGTYATTFSFVARGGDDLLALISAQPRERVLDLGCGTGRHVAALAAAGVDVLGADLDPAMLAAAAVEHPGLRFVAVDARELSLAALGAGEPFDAVLSNAALHWMQPQDLVLRNVRGVLRPGGRFVAEMGGAGNIAALDAALRGALADVGLADPPVPANFFPTVGQEAALLEAAGFRVEAAWWFRRPSPLPEGTTAADWTRLFRAPVWDAVADDVRDRLAAAVDARAAAAGLHGPDGSWTADYCRLRFVAVAA
jgi:SAM-dependent methyltransferase